MAKDKMNEKKVKGTSPNYVKELTDYWQTGEYQSKAQDNFDVIVKHIQPKRILDIGCGFAYESELFQKQFGSELTFIEGAPKNNARTSGWGNISNFDFYHDMQTLEREWQSRNLRYDLEPTGKYDLITSYLSLGHHYPVEVYLDMIKKHIASDGFLVLDLRKNKTHPVTGVALKQTQKSILTLIEARNI